MYVSLMFAQVLLLCVCVPCVTRFSAMCLPSCVTVYVLMFNMW